MRILLIISLVFLAACSEQRQPVAVWGSEGRSAGKFLYLEDLAIDAEGNLLVVDALRADIQRFTPDGEYLDRFGHDRAEPAVLEKPEGVGIDSNGNIWVSDYLSGHLQQYDAEGVHLGTYSSLGKAPGQTLEAEFMTIYNDTIYVAEAGNHRISVFNLSGEFESSFGSFGGLDGELNRPEAVKHDSQGRLLVTDFGNDRIQIFDARGNWLYTIGDTGSGEGQFRKPTGIALDDSDRIYVADSGNNRIQVLGSNGEFITQFGSGGDRPGEFENVHGLIVHGGHLFIADTGNHRIQKFTLP